jgi:iron complex outermembrane receptor protein/hemoglobin/transferrin/lactoferrin receptor protein
MSWRFASDWTLLANVEEGFAAPNLDDLTARQLTGQGYQIENPELDSERSLTYEIGLRQERDWSWSQDQRGSVSWELWGFMMRLDQGIERRDATCPMSERSCVAARVATPFTLINLDSPAWVRGVEQQLTLKLPASLTLQEHVAYARGEGPSPLSREVGQSRPLSRIPPLNGGVSLRWDSPERVFYLQLGARWAQAQDRLSFGDEIDHRVPYGGTPGYQVYHARLGARADQWELNLSLENLSDAVYRVHGSSVNGAARGASLLVTHSL